MAKIFFRDKPVIGLDISSTDIKVMAVDARKWLVLGYGSVNLEPLKLKESLEGDSPYLADNIKFLLKEKVIGALGTENAVIGVPTARSYSRTFTLPASAERTLSDAVELEADQYIPMPAATLSIDSEVIDRNKDQLTVLMSAVSRSVVDKIVAAAESAGLQPVMIEPEISGVARLLTNTEDGHLPTIIVDIGPASTDIAVLEQGTIRVTGGLNVGGNTFTLDIARKLSLTLENAHQLKVLNGLNAGSRQSKLSDALTPSLERISSEIRKVIRYYNERLNRTLKIEQLLIVGSGSNMPGIGEYFTNALLLPARVASPWQALDFGKLPEPARQFRPRYITVAGLASVDPRSIWK